MSSFSFQLVVRYKFLASLGGFAHSISIIGILNQPLKLQGTNHDKSVPTGRRRVTFGPGPDRLT